MSHPYATDEDGNIIYEGYSIWRYCTDAHPKIYKTVDTKEEADELVTKLNNDWPLKYRFIVLREPKLRGDE